MGRWIALVAVLGLACTGEAEDTTEAGCDGCGDDELCVIEFAAASETERCEPIPTECGTVGDCAVTECVSAMYDYCPAETSAWACSDTFPPTFISCTLP